MTYFDKTYHPPGTPPGTLISNENIQAAALEIKLIDYSSNTIDEHQISSIQDCKPYLHTDTVTWVHLQGGIDSETIKELGDFFDLHSLALEDVLNKGQRPKIDAFDNLLFVIMSMPLKMEGLLKFEQVSIFFADGIILSFCMEGDYPFHELRKRLHKKIGRIRNQKADYLLYCLLDTLIDQGYPALEKIGEQLEFIEEELLNSNTNQTILADIHKTRRELVLFRRNIWPHREVLNELLRDESQLIQKDTNIYLRDCYDHTVQLLDILDHYKELSASLIDVHHSTVSNRLNEIMRILTMISTIFIPLTFIAGLYGMNFSNPQSPWAMPELHWYFGYPLVIATMLIIVVSMLLFFKRKNWL